MIWFDFNKKFPVSIHFHSIEKQLVIVLMPVIVVFCSSAFKSPAKKAWRFLCFWNGGSSQGFALDIEFRFAVGALSRSKIFESFDHQDISEVDAVLNLTIRARAKSNEFSWK